MAEEQCQIVAHMQEKYPNHLIPEMIMGELDA